MKGHSPVPLSCRTATTVAGTLLSVSPGAAAEGAWLASFLRHQELLLLAINVDWTVQRAEVEARMGCSQW